MEPTMSQSDISPLDGELAGIDMGVSTSSLEERFAQAAKDIASLEEEIGINESDRFVVIEGPVPTRLPSSTLTAEKVNRQ
jgi:hypothetical protein